MCNTWDLGRLSSIYLKKNKTIWNIPWASKDEITASDVYGSEMKFSVALVFIELSILEYQLIKKKEKSNEVRNSRVTKLSYETKLPKMASHFESLTRKFL